MAGHRGGSPLHGGGADPRPLDLQSLSVRREWGAGLRGLKTGALVMLTPTEQTYWLGQARCRASRRAAFIAGAVKDLPGTRIQVYLSLS